MALQVWLPLIKDTNNYGLSQIGTSTVNGLAANSSGKLGGCYKGDCLYHLSEDILDNKWTIAAWVKSDSWGQYNDIIFCKNVSSSSDCQIYFSIVGGTALNIGINGPSSSISYGYTFSSNIWYHVAATYDGSKCIMYINGTKVKEGTVTTAKPTGKLNIGIGGRSTNTAGTSITGTQSYINDLRLYDHALSPREVAEIAKGLVLHYPLYTPGENLLSRYAVPGQNAPTVTTDAGRTKYYGDYGIIIPAQENADTYFRLFLKEQLVQNTVYTISCNASGVLNGTSYSFPLFARGNGAMGYLYINHNGLCSLTFTMTYSTQTAITVGSETVYLCFMDDGSRTIASGQGAITLTNFKIEKGSNATPWIPAITDPRYNASGFNTVTVFDTSGFGYNGTPNGSLTSGSDSPRYRSSTIFNGSDNAIQIPFNTMIGTELTDYSISVWFYKESIGTKNYQTIFGGPSGYELEARVSSGSDPLIKLYSWGGGQYAYQFNIWNHLVFVQTTTEVKCYLNGELVISGGTPKANPSGNYFIGSWNTTTQQNFEGKMSDFRIYATALTADQVKQLYEAPISLANNGTLFANEFNET